MPPLRFRSAGSPVRLQRSGTHLCCEASFPLSGLTTRLVLLGYSIVESRWPKACRDDPHLCWARRCPTGPLLRQGYAVPRHVATTTRAANLTLTPRLVHTTCACGLTSARPSLLWVTNHSPRAISNTPGHAPTALVGSFIGGIGLRPSSGDSARPISRNSIPAGEPFHAYLVFVSYGPRFR
jgi:hypothetical protein